MEETTDTKLIRRFWPPAVTSQFCICPIPYHFDTYRGCQYGCLYCFARDFIEFSRRKKTGNECKQSFLEGNSPEGLQKWIDNVLKMEYNYSKAETVAFKERIPVKIGATADPFPMIEKQERITYDCLKIFDKLDYPVQISTKNPEVFLSYAEDFVGSNIAFNVSCSFLDDDIARKIEPGAISPTRRFAAVKQLSDMGFKPMVRIQPFILPYSEKVAEDFVRKVKESGAWAFQTEGLKLRVILPQKEVEIYRKIGDILGFDIIGYFKKNGMIEGGDRCYNVLEKRRLLNMYNELAKKYDIKFYNADNLIDSKYGCGCECCGTDFLRNHKIWGGCRRTVMFPNNETDVSAEFGKCFVSFTRNERNRDRTIAEVCEEFIAKENKRLMGLDEEYYKSVHSKYDTSNTKVSRDVGMAEVDFGTIESLS